MNLDQDIAFIIENMILLFFQLLCIFSIFAFFIIIMISMISNNNDEFIFFLCENSKYNFIFT